MADSGLGKTILGKTGRRWRRFLFEIAFDAFLVITAIFAARLLISPGSLFQPAPPMLWVDGCLLAIGVVSVLFWRRIYSINVRYFGLGDFLEIGAACFAAAVVLFVLPALKNGLPSSLHLLLFPVLFGFLALAMLAGVRVVQRVYSWRRRLSENTAAPRNTLVVGAGDAAENILREISRSNSAPQRVVGLVDDGPSLFRSTIHGVRVVGNISQIPQLVKDYRVEEILIAMPAARGDEIRRVHEYCRKTQARVKMLPPIASILGGRAHLAAQVRDIEIEDLLRREPVKTDLEKIGQSLNGERVLITGGGGSIGSELARQIANLSPADLAIVGRGENSLYDIEQELLHTRHLQTNTIVTDVRDRRALEAAFLRVRPSVVFHAAAHKHVPLMQGNPIEAIRNNVLGTWQTAELAMRAGTRRFIYVSTDKAVKPSSVMGATKRVGEMIVQALGAQSEAEFGIVRFGNVLGSRGSLVPLLRAQIRRGGPVRVTHPEMTRYFMTIPEAVQLILQAATLGSRGEIFLLDMGQPIKILDIANDLIELEGLKVGEDIEIQFSGARPGEKIHEELTYDQEEKEPTSHPKISVVKNGVDFNWDRLKGELNHLLQLCDEGQAEEAKNLLFQIAWGKSPAFEYFELGT